MSTTLVIIGLPASGKTTVFNALTGSEAETGTYSGDTAEPNLANVKVPDARLDTLTELFNPQRRVPADVQYLDVAGVANGIAEDRIELSKPAQTTGDGAAEEARRVEVALD